MALLAAARLRAETGRVATRARGAADLDARDRFSRSLPSLARMSRRDIGGSAPETCGVGVA